jgi:uncharacterized membrane protein
MKEENQNTRLADLKKAILTAFIIASSMGVFLIHLVVLPFLNSLNDAETSILPLEILYVMPVLIVGAITRIIYQVSKRNLTSEE